MNDYEKVRNMLELERILVQAKIAMGKSSKEEMYVYYKLMLLELNLLPKDYETAIQAICQILDY